jgi:hypothetical protein
LCPNGPQHFQHRIGVHVSDRQTANVRVGVISQTVSPLLAVLVVFPSGLATRNETFRINIERDRARRLNLGFNAARVSANVTSLAEPKPA